MDGRQALAWILGAFVASIFIVAPSWSQQVTEEVAASGRKLPPPDPAMVWEHFTRTDPYRQWKLYPPKGGMYPSMRRGLTPATNPHGAYLKLYGNEIAIQNAREAEDLPMLNGAILVKEDYGKDADSLLSLTIMYKVDGYNPGDGDWFWARYGPAGAVMEAGKVDSCIGCHRTQFQHDWRFTGAKPHRHD